MKILIWKSIKNYNYLKKLGTIISSRIAKENTTGIITDGQIRRFSKNKWKPIFNTLQLKNYDQKPNHNWKEYACNAKALSLMNNKKITSLCVL